MEMAAIPATLALAHGVLVISVILIIGLPILAILSIFWYAQRM
jgi:hypothetical protein